MRHLVRYLLLLGALASASCFDSGTRWETPPLTTQAAAPPCTKGDQRCDLGKIQTCEANAAGVPVWTDVEDCPGKGLVCSSLSTGLACTVCVASEVTCQGQEVMTCRPDGSAADLTATCDITMGEACRTGGCQNLCQLAETERSNVGCEYWGVDLDNAMISVSEDAAAQQYALVISNAQPDVPVHVVVYQDDSSPGEPNAAYAIAEAVIAPYNLQVFDLGPREVDGSPPGQFNTGSNTALTRHAYKVTTDFPVVAFQFNPLDNVNVFSNDASLLKPREAVVPTVPGMQPAYVVAGWPQTIAITDDPNTNFDPENPIQLRAFLAIVGTAENTTVRVRTRARVVPGGPVPETPIGGVIEQTIGPFDVLNLETGDFLADFSGSVIEADGPVIVYSGSEASDAPHYTTLAERRCCADHLENQLDPLRTAGKVFAIAHNPSRTAAVKAAGAELGVIPEPDYVRFVAASAAGAVITTTLPPPDNQLILHHLGDMAEVTAFTDFTAKSTAPVHVAQVMPSQDASGVPRGLPGGDPSFVIYPPTEQYRAHYVFLTPDKYVFNFAMIVAPFGATVTLDKASPESLGCETAPGDGLTAEERGSPNPPWVVYRCQLSFPIINPLAMAPNNVMPGVQNDGVHLVDADVPVGVIVSGFDSYVSYAYAAGTELKDLTIQTQ
jgi:IgGFc binding protein